MNDKKEEDCPECSSSNNDSHHSDCQQAKREQVIKHYALQKAKEEDKPEEPTSPVEQHCCGTEEDKWKKIE